MLRGRLIHPEILGVLGTLGHGSRVLITDGNYPVATCSGHASQVYLNLSPGLVTVPQALRAVASAVPIEAVCLMAPEDGGAPEIVPEVKDILAEAGAPTSLDGLDRFAFYEAASAHEVGLAIHTGETRVYANLLLTIGVVPPA